MVGLIKRSSFSATIKLALTAASLCDFAFYRSVTGALSRNRYNAYMTEALNALHSNTYAGASE